jgi:SAM-dependent methyltransferase
MHRLEDEHWWYRALRDRIDIALDRWAPGFRSLLDAGCGTGGVLQHLQERRPEARLIGFDLSPDALRRCRSRGFAALARASVNDVAFRSAAFDVVTSHDVLYFEGIDDERAIAELTRVLAPGGILVLNLPAFEFLRGAHDEFVRGRRRYTRREVEMFLRDAGLDVLTATYWNAPLMPAVAVVRRLRRHRAHAAESDLRPLPRWLNRLLYALVRLEAVWLRSGTLPFGSSVLCVAGKPKLAARAVPGRNP